MPLNRHTYLLSPAASRSIDHGPRAAWVGSANTSPVYMSHKQPWSLSQDANKSSGICSCCRVTGQLHLKDGTMHQHGPRKNRCPGSNKLPLSTQPHPLASTLSQSSQPASVHASAPAAPAPTPALSATTITPTDTGSFGTTLPRFAHPHLNGPTIKHIP